MFYEIKRPKYQQIEEVKRELEVIETCLIVINIHICGENDKMIKKIEK